MFLVRETLSKSISEFERNRHAKRVSESLWSRCNVNVCGVSVFGVKVTPSVRFHFSDNRSSVIRTDKNLVCSEHERLLILVLLRYIYHDTT